MLPFEEAVEKIKEVLKRQPENLWLLRQISWALLQSGETKRALKYIDRALKIKPDNPYVLWEYGHIMLGSGDCEAALKIFKKIMRKATNLSKTYKKAKHKSALRMMNDCRYAIAD